MGEIRKCCPAASGNKEHGFPPIMSPLWEVAWFRNGTVLAGWDVFPPIMSGSGGFAWNKRGSIAGASVWLNTRLSLATFLWNRYKRYGKFRQKQSLLTGGFVLWADTSTQVTTQQQFPDSELKNQKLATNRDRASYSEIADSTKIWIMWISPKKMWKSLNSS